MLTTRYIKIVIKQRAAQKRHCRADMPFLRVQRTLPSPVVSIFIASPLFSAFFLPDLFFLMPVLASSSSDRSCSTQKKSNGYGSIHPAASILDCAISESPSKPTCLSARAAFIRDLIGFFFCCWKSCKVNGEEGRRGGARLPIENNVLQNLHLGEYNP